MKYHGTSHLVNGLYPQLDWWNIMEYPHLHIYTIYAYVYIYIDIYIYGIKYGLYGDYDAPTKWDAHPSGQRRLPVCCGNVQCLIGKKYLEDHPTARGCGS